MKKIFKYCTACCLAVVTLSACGDLYETHEKYLKMGEKTYIGLANDLEANGGFKRIELKWKLNADPKISTCVITWSGCEQPVIVPVNRSNEYMSRILEIPEGKYIFEIVVKSESGNESLPQTVSGEVYGDYYQSSLPQKGINSINITPKWVTIKWAPEEGCVGNVLTYTNTKGIEKSLDLAGDVTTTNIDDFVPGSKFTVYSLFKPEENAIDEIKSDGKDFSFPETPDYYVITKSDWDKTFHEFYEDVDRTGWTVKANTEELTGETSEAMPHNGQAVSLLDGDLNTFWHSAWSGSAAPPLPHEIIFDMQNSQDIMSIELVRRRYPSNNKDLKTAIFSISNDKVSWTEVGQMDFPNNTEPNAQVLILPQAVNGRYFRTMVTASNNGVNASIGEIMFTMGEKK